VLSAVQAGKLFSKLTKMAAAKIKDEGKLGPSRDDSNDSGELGVAVLQHVLVVRWQAG
jgi:hypothetical protein